MEIEIASDVPMRLAGKPPKKMDSVEGQEFTVLCQPRPNQEARRVLPYLKLMKIGNLKGLEIEV